MGPNAVNLRLHTCSINLRRMSRRSPHLPSERLRSTVSTLTASFPKWTKIGARLEVLGRASWNDRYPR